MVYIELGIVAVLIVINGLLAMSELAMVSSRPARLAALVEKNVGVHGAPWPWRPIPASFSRLSRSALRSSACCPARFPAPRSVSG